MCQRFRLSLWILAVIGLWLSRLRDITGGQVLPPTAVEEVLRLTNLEPDVVLRENGIAAFVAAVEVFVDCVWLFADGMDHSES